MITISEVIEQCAQEACNFSVENRTPLEVRDMIRDRIRTLKAKYEGCIAAEGEVRMTVPTMTGYKNLYRAKEPTK
jgi:hypothetical protein